MDPQKLYERFPHLGFMCHPAIDAFKNRDAGETILTRGRDIEHWPDFMLVTPDGRRFGLYGNFDTPQSLRVRMELRGDLNRFDIERLVKIDSYMLELDSDAPPVIFADRCAATRAWVELHLAFDIPLTGDEEAALDPDELGRYFPPEGDN